MNRRPWTYKQAAHVAEDFQCLVGREILMGRKDTAIRYVVVGPYDMEEQEHFARHFHLHGQSSEAAHLRHDGVPPRYDVLCIAVYDCGKEFSADIRLMAEELNVPYNFP